MRDKMPVCGLHDTPHTVSFSYQFVSTGGEHYHSRSDVSWTHISVTKSNDNSGWKKPTAKMKSANAEQQKLQSRKRSVVGSMPKQNSPDVKPTDESRRGTTSSTGNHQLHCRPRHVYISLL
jgi:hypothetical protein